MRRIDGVNVQIVEVTENMVWRTSRESQRERSAMLDEGKGV
jgi:hypothetical protein